MKKLVKFGLSALFIVTLTACGSSGGSSNNNDKPKTAEKTANASATLPNSETTHNSSDTTHNNVTINKQPTPTPINPTSSVNPDANIAAKGLKVGTVTRKNIVVDGKGLSLVPLSSPAYIGAPSPDVFNVNMKKEGGQYFGSVSLVCTMAKPCDRQIYAFYGSDEPPTAAMPTAGTAYYKGDVIYSYGGARTNNKEIRLTANFDTKQISGITTVIFGGAGIEKTANVTGNISGSSVTGKVSTDKVNADLAGKFYGANAERIVGVFGDANNQLSGAFGAEKK